MRFSKHTEAEAFNRRGLVHALSEYLGVSSVYNGMPTRSYTVGPYTIDGDGSIIGEDIIPLRDFLIGNGYAGAEDFEAPAMHTGDDTDEPAEEAETENGNAESGGCMVIGTPVSGMTVLALKNLVFMLYTKQYLLNRAFGEPLLLISEQLIARLQEYLPVSLDEFEGTLKNAQEQGLLKGFSYEGGDVKMAFPYDENAPEKWVLYSDLLNKIVHCALGARHTNPVLQKPENERYYMYSWLSRLGYGGADNKALRRLMIGNLKGYCAFPDENRAQKHKDRYKEIRRIRREINEEAEGE